MAENTKNRKNQAPQQNKPQQPDPIREANKDKMSNNPQAGIDESERMKQGNRQGNQPGISPDVADKNAPEAANGVDDIDEEDADEDKVTQRNPAQAQGRPDQRK